MYRPYHLNSFKIDKTSEAFTNFMNPSDEIYRDSSKIVVNETLYEQLGVSPKVKKNMSWLNFIFKSTLKEIRSNYHKKIKIYHSDRLPSEKKKEFYANRCNEINEAYNILSDSKKRIKYDILGLNQDLNLENEFKDKTEEEMRNEIKIQKMCYEKLKRDERLKSQSNIILNLDSNLNSIKNFNSNFTWRSNLNSKNFLNFKATTNFDLKKIEKSTIENSIQFQHNFDSNSIKFGSNINNEKKISFDFNIGIGSTIENPLLNFNLNVNW